MVRRHEIQVLRRAGHSLAETARLVGVSQSSVQRVATEPAVTTFDTDAERDRRAVGRGLEFALADCSDFMPFCGVDGSTS